MFCHKIVTMRGALAAIAGIVVVGAVMGVSRATGPEPTPTMHATAMMMNATAATMHATTPTMNAAAATVNAAATLNAEAMTPVAMLASFTWTGGSGDPDYWNEAANWSGAGGACFYPCTSADDATFSGYFGFAYFDASRTIDDLTVDDGGGSYFDGDGTARTLTCDTVVISGDTSGDTGGVHVTGLAGIETN